MDPYDAEFAATLGKEIAAETGQPQPQPQAPPTATPATPPQQQTSPPAGTPQLSQEQADLLSRQHVTPEMFARFTPPEQTAFLQNAAKREADQASEYNRLRQQAETGGQQPQAQAAEPGEAPSQEAGQPPATPFLETATKAIETMAETFGDEIKPLQGLMEGVNAEMAALRQQADQAARSTPIQNRILGDLTVDMAVQSLAADFPSLRAPEARNQVVAKFQADWPNSPHKNNAAIGPLDRVRLAMRDAATATITTTEAAAQASLVDTTKERLGNQPVVASGRSTPSTPVSDDQIYGDAYTKILEPEVRAGR